MNIKEKHLVRLKKIIRDMNTRIELQNKENKANTPLLIFDKIINSKLGYQFEQEYKKNKRTSLIQKHKGGGYEIENITVGIGPKKGEAFSDKTKVCLKCLLEKEINFFWKTKKGGKNIPASRCKECEKNRRREKEYVIYSIYKEQRRSSREKGYPAPEYDLKWFMEWCNNSKKFSELYNKWKDLKYDVYLRPSIDRINPLKPYLKNNIQVMTWGENAKKGRTTDKHIHFLNRVSIIDEKSNIETIKRVFSYLSFIYDQQKEKALEEGYNIDYSQKWFIRYVTRDINIKDVVNEDISNIKNIKEIFSVEKILKEEKYSGSNIKIVFYGTDQQQ